MLVDSHCHLHNAEHFPGGAEDYLTRAKDAGVERVVVIGTSHEDSLAACEFAEKHAGVFWTYGVHPSEIEKTRPAEVDFSKFQSQPVAIGEVGLDYHYGPEDFGGMEFTHEEMQKLQFRLLEEMLELGIKNDLPFSFHVREAFDDFFSILDNFSGAKIRGVVHSFSDNKKNLRKVLERDFYVGVNGMATYSTLPQPPLERVLLETDAPYLAPIPHRHERNEPAYIADIAKWMAEKYETPLEDVVKITTKNVADLFGIA